MQFRTQIPVQKNDFPIDYHSRIVSLGSCFAENIAEKFQYFQFQNFLNPFGIVFNAVSLEKLILRCVNITYFTEDDLFFFNERWNCFEVHSELSIEDKKAFLENLNRLVDEGHKHLREASHVILTLGTSWVYQNNSSGEIVANCHKVPQKEFEKILLSSAQTEKSLARIIAAVSSINKHCQFIFTVSPVRHIKDGFIENQVSKANLITAVYGVCQEYRERVIYFPSYEILMDELRDYRFYAEDMLHPNTLAIDYIWECFTQGFISENVYSVMEEIDAVRKALQHRPFNPDSENHQKFLKKLNDKILLLHLKYEHFKF